MPHRPLRHPLRGSGPALSRRLLRNVALAASWLAIVGGASTASAAAAGQSTGLGSSRVLHDTSSTKSVGAIFHGAVSAGDHFCSAGVVDSPGHDLIVTAAHCMSDGTDDLYFVPGYHDGVAPYGVWRLGAATLDPRWDSAQDPDLDVGFVAVRPLDGREVQDVVGGSALETGRAPGALVRLTGYPAGADAPLTCVDHATPFTATQLRIVCAAYSGGTSGSPWVTSRHTVIGVIGGYQQGGDTPDISYSAYFGDAVAALYQRAVARP